MNNKKMLYILMIIIGVLLIITGSLLFLKTKVSEESAVAKICKYVNMRGVQVTAYVNNKKEIGGYFAAAYDMDYKDAPGYLFDKKGNWIATDSFFNEPETRAAFLQQYNNLTTAYPTEKIYQCK